MYIHIRTEAGKVESLEVAAEGLDRWCGYEIAVNQG